MLFPAGIYRVKNVRSGTYITGSAGEPNAVGGWESRPDDDSQKWELERQSSRDYGASYHFRNLGDGRYLSVSGVGGGAKVGKGSEVPTRWVLSEISSTGQYFINVEGSEAPLELSSGNAENNAPITLSSSRQNDSSEKKWRIKRISGNPAAPSSAYSLPSGRQANQLRLYYEQLLAELALEERETPLDQHAGIIPLATYSIRNVQANGSPLNPNPYGSSKWIIQAGQQGYLLKSKSFGTFLGYQEKQTAEPLVLTTTESAACEWLISRAHGGYYICPAKGTGLFIGLKDTTADGSNSLCLSDANSRSMQVWKFELANA